jgi:hypothetical protein
MVRGGGGGRGRIRRGRGVHGSQIHRKEVSGAAGAVASCCEYKLNYCIRSPYLRELYTTYIILYIISPYAYIIRIVLDHHSCESFTPREEVGGHARR